jgi:cell division protease FtsH
MFSYSFIEVMGYIGIGVYLSILYHFLSITEPFSYYLPFGIGKYYRKHLNVKTRYSDVIGNDELKKEISDTIAIFQQDNKDASNGKDSSKDNSKNNSNNSNDNQGKKFTLLFKGKSGTGKTFTAQAIAGECNLPFIEVLTDEMNSRYMPTVINSIIKKYAPCIIFVDECHSLFSYNSEYMLRTLDSMTSCKEKVIFIFVTNKAETIDGAMTRAGRIDKIINFDAPTKDERVLHIKSAFPSLNDKECILIAEKMGKISQAQMNFLKREFNFLQKRHILNNTKSDTISDIYHLIEKLQLGYHTQSQVYDDEEKYRIAIHEIGHAFVSFILSSAKKPTKISINGVGSYAGYNIVNFDDTRIYTKQKLLSTLCVYYAGYMSEKHFFKGNSSTLVVADMEMVKNILKIMSNCMMIKNHRYNGINEIHGNDSETNDDNGNGVKVATFDSLMTNDFRSTDSNFVPFGSDVKVEKFLIEQIFEPYHDDIHRLANLLLKETCFEGSGTITQHFEPYQDKITDINIDI